MQRAAAKGEQQQFEGLLKPQHPSIEAAIDHAQKSDVKDHRKLSLPRKQKEFS